MNLLVLCIARIPVFVTLLRVALVHTTSLALLNTGSAISLSVFSALLMLLTTLLRPWMVMFLFAPWRG